MAPTFWGFVVSEAFPEQSIKFAPVAYVNRYSYWTQNPGFYGFESRRGYHINRVVV